MAFHAHTVFIAYAHADLKWLEATTTHLKVLQSSPSVDVWSDRRIQAGDDWLEEIESAIKLASLAVILISVKFLTSDFISRVEVPALLKRRASQGFPVIPILVRDCAWNQVQWLSKMQMRPSGASLKALATYTSAKAETQLANITNEIADILNNLPGKASPQPKKPSPTTKVEQRAVTLPVGGLKLPCYFPSISGAAKSNFSPLAHLEVLVQLRHPCFLASVYDFVKVSRNEKVGKEQSVKMKSLIDSAHANGQVVLLDCGMYERKWLRDSTWSRRSFHAALPDIKGHIGFFFDDLKIKTDASVRTTAVAITTRVQSDRRIANLNALFPIIHPRNAQKREELPDICKQVALELDCEVRACRR